LYGRSDWRASHSRCAIEYSSIYNRGGWLSNPNSIRSELEAEFRNSSIANIIDGQRGTFWIMPILCREARSSGVPMEIALHMNSAQDINYVEIEPACNFPLWLVGIDYYDSNSNRQSVDTSGVLLTGPTRINFGRVTTRVLILRFRQDNYQEVQFVRREGSSNFERAILGEFTDGIDMEAISEDLRHVLSSDFVLTDLLGVQNPASAQAKYFEYTIGFDNIRAGFSTFNERGIFVSNKKTVSKPGQIAVKATEVRPTQLADYTTITLDPLPILPATVERIQHSITV